MPLDKTQVRFAVAVAMLAAGLLGESAGATIGDGCPQGDPDCYAGVTGDHQLCQYQPPTAAGSRR